MNWTQPARKPVMWQAILDDLDNKKLLISTDLVVTELYEGIKHPTMLKGEYIYYTKSKTYAYKHRTGVKPKMLKRAPQIIRAALALYGYSV